MIFKQAYILILIQIIAISESVILMSKLKRMKRGREKKIPLAPTVINATFLQKLDHFNPTDVRTWKQVYYKENSYYKKGGPAYLFIEGESPADPYWFEEGYWQAHGKKNKAILFMLEHRFYGNSNPWIDTKTAHLTYLTTHQALADLATFIVSMNNVNKLPERTKWIVFGCSYAGNLAAWMRLKYPHLVHGAVASSAPVLAQFDFPEYLDVVSNALASYNKQCQSDIALANNELDKMAQTKKGRIQIGKLFELCTPLSERSEDKAYLLENMVNYLTETVQYDTFGKRIQEACDEMLEKSNISTPVNRYSSLMNFFMVNNADPCLSTNYTEWIEDTKQGASNASNSDRAWLYQTCTEYGYYQTTRKSNSTFSSLLTLDYEAGLCKKVFNTSFTNAFIRRAVNNTNISFGGLKLNVNRVVFINGDLDPWHTLSITSTTKWSNVEAILIKGGSHCSDFYDGSDEDSNDVKAARSKVQFLLDKWLKDER